MNFCSDNVSGVLPDLLSALIDAADGSAMPYGADAWSERLDRRLSEVFETPVEVFPVGTGTAANALALWQLTPPFGAVFCHEESHVAVDECGAPEMFTGGAKVVGVAGEHGKLDPTGLEAAIGRTGYRMVHRVRPAAVSVTQATEFGTVYTPAEIADLAAVCRRHGLPLHMDGARFANALAAQGCTPAEMTWRAGVDVLSLGATKGGAIAAEAVVFLRPGLSNDFAERRKRAGHLASKMRFASAQLLAWVNNDLWIRAAGHANAMARALADGMAGIPEVRVMAPVESNMVFAALPPDLRDGLRANGVLFYDWPSETPGLARFVTHVQTTATEVTALLETARRLAAVTPRPSNPL